ncbi:glycosyltransferase [Humibacter ginsenosidimutans]|uniref:D-inositol 3-phosphate glycosyltransferase n=1 Tax=Humibacter ginsenosidimutans TaxID=2599293 RepID=A0A5B8M9V2_9MICO|nr:glycosyltransferase [Humibacter ginsenosidimutans]QDZ16432.1 glycosyltransferase family 4 protein [Humibacter ginsenosidimutans]
MTSTYPAHAGDGTPAFVRDLAREESKTFDVMVLAPRVAGAPSHELDGAIETVRYGYFPRRWERLADGAIIENLRARRSNWLQVVPFLVSQWSAMRRARRRFSPDVVHVHWIIPQGVVADLALRGVPRLITTLGGDLYALNGAVLRRLKAAVVTRASEITVMNDEMRRMVIELGARPERVQVMPMGVDTSMIVRKTGESQPADSNPSLQQQVKLLFVGRLVEKKGLAVLIEALEGLSEKTSENVRLKVVGDGPLRGELARAAENLRVPVDFVGQLGRAQLASAYQGADIVVTPSVPASSGDKDGLPVAMLEAMTMGLPVIASDVPGINEVVVDDVSGVLVPPGDVQRLSFAIERLVNDDARRERLGTGAARASEGFFSDCGRRTLCSVAARDPR